MYQIGESNRIEKIDSVARIESKLFCLNWNALLSRLLYESSFWTSKEITKRLISEAQRWTKRDGGSDISYYTGRRRHTRGAYLSVKPNHSPRITSAQCRLHVSYYTR